MKTRRGKALLNALLWCGLSTVLAVFIVLFFSSLPLRADLSTQRLFSLSASSKASLSRLSEKVRIAAVYPDGNANVMVASLLEAYSGYSDMIELAFIDAERDPGLLALYDLGDARTVTRGTIIVNSRGRRKLVYESDMFFEGTTGNQFYGERVITGAIRFVSSDILPVAYFVVGHGERDIYKDVSRAAELLNTDVWDVRQLPLLQMEKVPENAGVLVFVNPVRDLHETEAEMLLNYLAGGGAVFLLLDPSTSGIVLPFFEAIVQLYGIGVANNFVIEEDSSYYYGTNNLYLIPRYAPHLITSPLAEQKKMVILPMCRGISQLAESSSDVKTTALLYSSDKSRARMDMGVSGMGVVSSDILGPVPLAYASVKDAPGPGIHSSRIVVAGDSDFIVDNNINIQGNGDLFLNTMNWLLGARESGIIPGKTINADLLMIRGRDFIRLAIICCVIIPLIFFSASLVIWFQNRNR